MGRYSTDVPSTPYKSNQTQGMPQNWPTSFPNTMISLDLNGTIVEDRLLTGAGAVAVIPGVLDAIRLMRLKGHGVFILSDQPDISLGKIQPSNIEQSFNHLMQVFGQAGILSIDGFLYNTSNQKQDKYAKPNIGMITRATTEINPSLKFKGGYHVGDSIDDLKMAQKAKMTPVLVLTGNGHKTLKDLEKHSNQELKKKTLVFQNLLEFVNTL